MSEEKDKKKQVPGDPVPMTQIAGLLFGVMRKHDVELAGLDIRGSFRIGSDNVDGSIVGAGEDDWKLYETDSWEYRFLIEKEIKSLKIKKCDRIVTMFRHKKTGEMFQGRILDSPDGDELEWRLLGMKPQGT